jgi:hypothetical protein
MQLERKIALLNNGPCEHSLDDDSGDTHPGSRIFRKPKFLIGVTLCADSFESPFEVHERFRGFVWPVGIKIARRFPGVLLSQG